MHFRVSFFKQTPYFIADFNEKDYNSNIILYSSEGEIYATSKNIHQIIGSRQGSIFEVLNNISYYFEKYELGTIFEYDEDVTCSMQRANLQIDDSMLEVLYIINDDYFAQIKNLGKAPAIESDEWDYKSNYNSHITIVQTESNAKLEPAISHSYFSTMHSGIENNENFKNEENKESSSEKVMKFCNSMNMKVRLSVICLLGIIISTLLLEKHLIKDLNLSIFISNFATMRFLGLNILSDSRSLDLLSQGYNLSSTETAYRTSLQTNLLNLKIALTSTNSDISNYSYLTNYLEENEIITVEKLSSNLYRTNKINLFQALQKVIQEGSAIANAKFSNFSDIQTNLFYIYWNFPGETFRCLNASLYSTIKEMQENTLSVLELLKYLKILAFIPALLIISLSVRDIINLEKYNKKNWKSLSSLSIERKVVLKEKLIDRLYNFHGLQVDEVQLKRTKKKIYSFIWKSFIFKILLLELSSIFYYFISIYVLQNQISDALISQTDYRFSSGLRRSLTRTTYFWAREQFLDKSNASFITNILHPFPSIPHKLQFLIDDYRHCQKFINYGPVKKYYNDEMVSLMIGNPCTQLNNTIAKCQSSYISMGIVPSIELYLNEVRRVATYKKTDWKDIIKLEQYSKLISSSVGSMVNIFMNTTDAQVADTLDDLVVTTLLYFLLMIIIAMLIVFTAVNKMKSDLIDKIEILKYFEG
ncbi:unnamed protein product [Blepharisma stoltei]|uniref:Uncharacterized protein n=1 Tax=Blepharisma stoltei TaxID=1481888 RepID=A0AAU9KP70_9CILI|nr:unnamed protein product [Blepharisma stoltei]